MLAYNIIKYSYLMFAHKMFAQYSFQIHILEPWKPFKFPGSRRRRFPRCRRKCPQRDCGKVFSSVHYTQNNTFIFFQTSIQDPRGEDSQDVAESVLKDVVVSHSLVCIIQDIFCFFQTSIGNSWSSVFSMVSGHYDDLF